MLYRAGVEADFLCSHLRSHALVQSTVSSGKPSQNTRLARPGYRQALRLVRRQVDRPPKVVERRGVPVLEVGLPAHLLRLFEAERVHVKFRVGVDQVLEDDIWPRIAEIQLKIPAD